MSIIGYSPWQDAERFGQGVGQSLEQGLMQLPQQRYAMALRQAQLQQAEQYRQQQIAIAQQRASQQGQYQQGMLGLRQQMGENQNQNAQLANQVRMLMAQIAAAKLGQGHVEQNYWVPGVGSIGQGVGMEQGGAPDFGPYGNTPQTNTPTQSPQQLPGGVVPLPGRSSVGSSTQADANTLRLAADYMGLLNHTNIMQADPQLQQWYSNRLYGASAPMQQTNAVPQQFQGTNQIGRFLVQPIQ